MDSRVSSSPGQAQGLTNVLEDAPDGVGGDGAGEDGVLLAEALMHPSNEFIPQIAGKVQVDVRQQAGVLGDEPLQGEAPLQGVHVADTDEVAHQQGYRGAPAPARRTFFQGRLRVGQPPFLHYLLGQQDNLPVQQQEAGQAVPANQLEFFLKSLLHLPGDRAVTAHRPFPA